MAVFDSAQLVIGEATQYFIDDLLMESVENIRRTFHSPRKVGEQPVVQKDKPWEHLDSRRPWLSPRGPGHWDACMNTIPSPPIRVGDELYVFHGGARNHHDCWITGEREGLDVPEATDINEVAYGLGLAKLRADGFCSLEAGPARDGIVVTRPWRQASTCWPKNPWPPALKSVVGFSRPAMGYCEAKACRRTTWSNA